MPTLDAVEVQHGDKPDASVIWLHGLGADGHDFEPIVPELRLPSAIGLRFVFPHAPVRPVTVNGGMAMRAWYDIVTFDAKGRADAAGLDASCDLLEGYVAREIERGIAADRIVIAGFSQGGAVAIQTALRTQHKLAGLMALSTYLAKDPGDKSGMPRNRLPVFMAHGTFDPVLSFDWGRAAKERLDELGFKVEWHEYPMAHAVCGAEIAAISDWLLSVLS